MTQPETATSGPAPAWGGHPWPARPLVGFDLETTGVDPLTARVVTAAVVHHYPDGTVGRESSRWLVDPGVPIPARATEVHGVTTEYAREHGVAPAGAIGEIAAALQAAWNAGLPVVIFNAAYDLTLLTAALQRHGLPTLTTRTGWESALLIDPLVIDRGVDRYRRGKRTLQAMAEHYGVMATDAHSADGDALAACGVARAIAAAHPDVARADTAALRSQQQQWSTAWATNFQAYLRSRDKPDAVIDGTWPLRGV